MADKVLGISISGFKQAVRRRMIKAMAPIEMGAKSTVQVLNSVIMRKGKVFRIPGTVRDRITIRNSKNDAKEGNVGVFVNVKPLPGNKYRKVGTQAIVNKHGETVQKGIFILTKKSLRTSKADNYENPRDPWYWKFLEIGRQKRPMPFRPFLKPQRSKLPAAEAEVRKGINEYFERRGK